MLKALRSFFHFLTYRWPPECISHTPAAERYRVEARREMALFLAVVAGVVWLAASAFGGAVPAGRIAMVEKSLWAKRGQAAADFAPSAEADDPVDKDKRAGLPAVRMKLWGGHDEITLTYRNAGKRVRVDATPSGKGKRFQVGSYLDYEPATRIDFPDGSSDVPESGGLITRLVLDKAPTGIKAGGTWTATFDLALPADAQAFYQGELTTFEIETMHATRPAWCVGSYAIYSADSRKLAHLVRPWVRDAKGKWAWATQKYDAGTLTVAVPSDWLLAAAYPVEVDPTFGYTSVGKSSAKFSEKEVAVTGTYSPASNGTTDSVSWYLQRNAAGDVCTFGVYLDKAGVSDARVVDTAEVTVSSAAGWNTSNTDSAAAVSSGSVYWVAIHTSVSQTVVWYDTTSGPIRYSGDTAYVAGAIPDPCPATTLASGYQYSAYVTYTATAASTVPLNILNRNVPFLPGGPKTPWRTGP